MERLNLPGYPLKTRLSENNIEEVFDPFRKKWVRLTPEERVRQLFLMWLVLEKKFPSGLLAVEKGISVNGMQRRFDAVLFDGQGKASVLFEFKAPTVKLTNDVVDQIVAYNRSVRAKYLIISNGINHYCIHTDYENNRFTFLQDIPEYVKL